MTGNFLGTHQGKVDFSILIPVYNSEQSLPLVLEGVRKVFAENGLSYEFVLVDDGSPDGVWSVIENEYGKGDVCAISFLRNHGHSVAMKRGLEFCRGEWVVTMDDDLQHPPSELPKLINATRESGDMDVIMGSYSAERGELHRTLGSRLFQWVLNWSFDVPEGVTMTSFRAIHRRVVDQLVARNLSSPHASIMILSCTDRIRNIDVERHDRRFGQSGMKLGRSISIIMDNVILNSEWPLKVIGLGGLAMAGLAMILAIYYFLKYLVGDIGVSGFTTTVLLIVGFSGVILGAISVVGLYIMRLLQQATFTPAYSLRKHLPLDQDT